MGFDVVFGYQHWVLYPEGKRVGEDDEAQRGLEGDGEDEERALLRPEVDAEGTAEVRSPGPGGRGRGGEYGAVDVLVGAHGGAAEEGAKK